MVLQQISPEPISEPDDSVASGIAIPTGTTATGLSEAYTSAGTPQTITSSVPCPEPILEPDDSVASGIATPTETTATDLSEASTSAGTPQIITSSVPCPGSCYIIRSAGSAGVITLKDGLIKLSPPGGRGSIYWECVERQGWLGFKDPGSGLFLGHNVHGRLGCWASRQRGWENFCARAKPEGGFMLLMTHWEQLWVLDRMAGGDDELEKVPTSSESGIVWDFIKV